jgi:4-hydroxy-3-methylbut-2-enyl diphosphate reductase
MALVAQTTFFPVGVAKMCKKLKKVCTKLEIFDTICIATEKTTVRSEKNWPPKMTQ